MQCCMSLLRPLGAHSLVAGPIRPFLPWVGSGRRWFVRGQPRGDVSSLLYATPPPSRSGPKAPRGGGGGGGGGALEGAIWGGGGGGGAQAPVTSPCPPSGVRARARVTELVEPVLVL